MKRRLRTHPSNPYYSTEPAVAEKDIASQSLVQNASLGNRTPKSVPKKPAESTGIGFPIAKENRPKAARIKNLHPAAPSKPMKVPAQSKSHYRMSGHPGAHMLGGIKKLKSL